MRNPVFMAFHMDWLDPEDRAAIMRWRIRLAVFCSLLGLILAPVIAAEPGGMTQCALCDLPLVTSIEMHGEAQDVPAARLAEAFFALVNARRTCAAGRIDEALAIYDGIVVALAEVRKE